jgi:hypothetical protein
MKESEMPKALSATVPEALEASARDIARRENRSISNVVENALGVFTALPRDLRDQLVARLAAGGPRDAHLREAAHEMTRALVRKRYEAVRADMATTFGRRGGALAADPVALDDWALSDEVPGR